VVATPHRRQQRLTAEAALKEVPGCEMAKRSYGEWQFQRVRPRSEKSSMHSLEQHQDQARTRIASSSASVGSRLASDAAAAVATKEMTGPTTTAVQVPL
jgi:hypothetical protein